MTASKGGLTLLKFLEHPNVVFAQRIDAQHGLAVSVKVLLACEKTGHPA